MSLTTISINNNILANSSSPWLILCDFDGTISFNDVTDTLLNRFGLPGWQDLEEQWQKGQIGSKQCMAGQISLLNMSKHELDQCLKKIKIDPHFVHFYRWTQQHGVPLCIVSDGLDYAIHTILMAHGIVNLPIVANHLEQIETKRWKLSFPWYQKSCSTQSGTCKCAISRFFRPKNILLIGDGRSDFCVAREADYVFAKDKLIQECQRLTICYIKIKDFATALFLLPTLINSHIDPINTKQHP